jgi:hypothetical protein
MIGVAPVQRDREHKDRLEEHHMRYLLASAAVLGMTAAAMGDWPHPIKWDQMSDGFENFGAHSRIDRDDQIFTTTADDFLCGETGWITDIHFAGFSQFGDIFLNGFNIKFWTDVPATPDDESHPGQLLYEYTALAVDPADPLGIGWQALGDGTYRINLPEDQWFQQEEGNIYWISIQGDMVDDGFGDIFYWNFADPAFHETWGDDAAFEGAFFGFAPWANWGFQNDPANPGEFIPDLYEGPFPGDPFVSSADMAFALSGIPIPAPGVLALLGLAGLARNRRR